MTEIDYGGVFEVETAGENVTEPAEPSDTTETTAGEEAQEPAAPAADEETQEEAPKEEPKKTEQDAKFAAARRKAERDAEIAKIRQEAQEEANQKFEQFFANSGLVNPYTRQPIRSKAEYDAYRVQYEAEQKASLLKKSGMSDAEFQAFVSGLPEVRQAREAQAKAEAAEREVRAEQAKLKVAEQLKEIQAIDPNIKELKDLAKLETYPQLYDMVKRGYSIADAYRLSNFDALTQKAAEASRQAAMNAAKSKEHLNHTVQRGAGAVTVPEDVKAEYLAFNPGATEAEIQKHYQKYMKH